MGRLRKKAAGKAREPRGMRRTLAYAAMTKGEAQRSIRTFYEAVRIRFPDSTPPPHMDDFPGRTSFRSTGRGSEIFRRLSSIRTRIVVPYLRAIALSVSPLLTRYTLVPEFSEAAGFPG